MTVTAIAVNDMHCSACTSKIEKALSGITGVEELKFNPVRRHVLIEHAPRVAATELIRGIESAGFHPALLGNSDSDGGEDQRTLLKRLGIAGLAMAQVMMIQISLYAGAFQGIEAHYARLLEFTALAFCIPVVSYSAMPFFVSAVASVRRGLNMDAPIALAITIAFAASLYATLSGAGEVYYDSVVMFTFLMLSARYLEHRLKHRLAIEDSLLASLPQIVTVIRDGSRQQVPLAEVAIGDEVWVGEGEQIPVDGALLSPRARIEEAMLTGESDWAEKTAGEIVYAGTLNQGGALSVQVQAMGSDARIGQIDQLATSALADKRGLARLADHVARYFIPSILLLAGATYLVWQQVDPTMALSATLAVLVVSCPCALSLATPAAITAALARLRQAGVLVKRSAALEQAHTVRRVFMDKTGTLTSPDFIVTKQNTESGFEADFCRTVADTLQAHAAHPVARAFRTDVARESSNITVHREGVEGTVLGVNARIGSAAFAGLEEVHDKAKTVYLSIAGRLAATFEVSSEVRKDAAQTVHALQAQGLSVEMLSGDTEAHCRQLAEQLNIGYRAQMTPEAKNAAIDAADELMFVGDGINDIPAITRAGLSVSTMETNDLVKSRADVVLLSQRLTGLVDLLQVSDKSRHIMWQNLFWALAYNVIAIPLAAFGYAPPWVAALGMSASSLLVMLNATRILRTPLYQEAK